MAAPAWRKNLPQSGGGDVDLFTELGVSPEGAPEAAPEESGPWTLHHNMNVKRPENIWEGITYPFRVVEKTGENVAAIAGKGARDLAVNVAALPTDIAEYAGLEQAGDVSRWIRNTVPDIELESSFKTGEAAANVASELIQYGVPAQAAANTAEKVLRGAPKLVKWGGQLLAAISGDVAAAGDKNTQTLGNMFGGGPTAIRPGDTGMERRAKIGAEAGVLYTVLTPIVEIIRHGAPIIGRTLKALGAPEDMAETIAAQTIRDAAEHGEEVAAARLAVAADELGQGGFKPTTGTASNDPGLIAMERGLVTATGKETGYHPSVKFAQRKRENIAATGEQVKSVTEGRGRPGQATDFFEQDRTARMAAAEEEAAQRTKAAESRVGEAEATAKASEEELAAARAEVDDIVGAQTATAEGRTAASEQINETVRDELTRVTAEKNRLAKAVDPDNNVPVNDSKLKAAVKKLKTPKGRSLPIWRDLPGSLRKRINAMLPKAEKGTPPPPPLTLGALQDFRGRLSDAARALRRKGRGDAERALAELRDTIDSYIDDVAERGDDAAARAKEFQRYYREEFAPRFGKETAGGKFRKATKEYNPVKPSETGQTFWKPGGGSKETARNLRTIIEGAKDPAEAAQRVRNYVIADFAEKAVSADGKINRRLIFEYLRRHKDALDQFPDLQREIKAMARRNVRAADRVGEAQARVKTAQQGVQKAEAALQKEVEAASAELKQTADEYKRSVAGYFIDADPVKAMGRVITSERPDKAMAELVKKTQGSAQAREGLASALGEWVSKRVRAMDERETVKLARMEELLGDKRVVRALEMLHGKEDVAVLKRVRDQLRMANRINEQVTAGSPTASLRESTKIISLALDLKFGIMRGRRYLNAISWLSDFVHGEKLKDRVLRLITEAMLDPEKARTLLKNRNNREAQRKALEWMGKRFKRTRAAGQLLSEPPAEQQRQ